jgi:hypothetical protein
MKRKAVCLFTAFTVALGVAIPLHAQTPPNVGNQFSTEFVGNANQDAMQAVFEGTVPDGRNPGFQKGRLVFDYTNQRIRVDFLALDGTPQKTVFDFYGRQLQYISDPVNNTCQSVPLTPVAPWPHLFGWLGNATLLPPRHKENFLFLNGGAVGGPVTLDTWEYRAPHGSALSLNGLAVADDSSRTPIFTYWRFDHPDRLIEVDFNHFVNSVNSADYVLPAACVI